MRCSAGRRDDVQARACRSWSSLPPRNATDDGSDPRGDGPVEQTGPVDADRTNPPSLDTDPWNALGRQLRVSPGVHHPSAFSAVLAAALPDLDGLTVVDAGSGAGLVTIAALARGAGRVIALDRQESALEDTAANVLTHLGPDARSRLVLQHGDWSALRASAPGTHRPHVILVNPPQRPTAVLERTLPRERHHHVDGGPDGLAALHDLLSSADADAVITTASSLLRAAETTLARPPFSRAHRLTGTDAVHDRAWAALVPGQRLSGDTLVARVDVWQLDHDDGPAASAPRAGS